jgi:catechol 2,3-dioxygenase-like lactoylglutathione lyase family enzyme
MKRGARLLGLALVLAFAPLAWAARAAQQPAVSAVESVGITVADLEREIEFFTGVLTFQLDGIEEDAGPENEALEGVFGLRTRVARLHLGGERLELTQFLAPEGRPYPAESRSNDRWFQHVAIIVSDMEKAYAALREHGVRHASSGPQRLPDWNLNAGGIEAFYFKDPEGHVLEVLAFPAGKGDPKWHRLAQENGALFLGIDHTAIVVQDTEASLAFYRDVLGMRVAGASENWGTEQEHLNNVFGARLRITSLRAAAGPGIEFLEYLAPSDGRPYPLDARANDLVHWETRLTAADLPALETRLRAARSRFVSPGAVALESGTSALLVRDPDGHAVELHASSAVPAAVRKP